MQSLKTLEALHKSCNPRCITTRCRRDRCALRLPRQGVLCVDCDRCSAFPKERKRPDFIVLHVGGKSSVSCWLIVEMKGRVAHPRDIVEQLQIGAWVIQNDPLFQVPQSFQDLVALLLHDGHIHDADYKSIGSKRISFRGKLCRIKISRCGTELKHLLV